MFICEKCGNKPLNNAAIEGALYRADMINKRLAIVLVVCIIIAFLSNAIQFYLWAHFCENLQSSYTHESDEIVCLIPNNTSTTKALLRVYEYKPNKRKF